MNEFVERRREKRLQYNWPVWFAEECNDLLSQGQMVDISSNGASFTCYSDKCPDSGKKITTRFSVPRYDVENTESFDLANFIREGKICRIDEVSAFVKRVAVQFEESLPFKPGEMTDSEALMISGDLTCMPSESNDEAVEHAVRETV